MKKHITILIIILLGSMKLLSQDSATPGDISSLYHRFQSLESNTNTLYSPAFRASWTMLVNEILEEKVKLHPTLPLAEELNKYTFDPGENTEWLTVAGFIEDGIIDKLDRQMNARFKINAPGLEDARKAKEGIICYSYLRINALFEKVFEEFKWNFQLGDAEESIQCFGVSKGNSEDKEALRRQLIINDYRNPDDFILRLLPSDQNLEIIITEMNPGENIYETIMEIDRRINESFNHHPSGGDELIIPKISLNHTHSYEELLSRYLQNKGFEEYFFAAASQGINLSLDQSGAIAEVSGKILLKKGPAPRIYAIDRPFLLLIREVGNEEPIVFLRICDLNWLKSCKKN